MNRGKYYWCLTVFRFMLIWQFLTAVVYAQNLPAKGAVCYYTSNGFTGNPYTDKSITKYICTTDTVINASTYKVLQNYSISKTGQETYIQNADIYLHDSVGFVFFYNNGKKLLFNFNAAVSDTFFIDAFINKSIQQKQIVIKNIVTDNNTGIKTFIFNTIDQSGIVYTGSISQKYITFSYYQSILHLLNGPAIPEGNFILSCYSDSTLNIKLTNLPCNQYLYTDMLYTGNLWYITKYKSVDTQVGNFIKIKVDKDTLVNNIKAKKLTCFYNNVEEKKDIQLLLFTDSLKRVYIHTKSGFALLYNFSAKVGDTITAGIYYHPDLALTNNTAEPEATTFKYVIDSIFVGANNMLVQRVKYLGNVNWTLGEYLYEGIGSLGVINGYATSNLPVGIDGYVRCMFNLQASFSYIKSGYMANDCAKITGTASRFNTDLFEVFPNPAVDKIYINTPEYISKYRLKIVDIAGNIITDKNINMVKTEINLSQIKKGIYILIITTNNNNTYYKKLLIN